MPTILYAWELGGGLGHLLRFAPLAEMLVARGHRVVAAVRELKNAGHAFGRATAALTPVRRAHSRQALSPRERERTVGFLPAPHLNWPAPGAIDPVYTYAELLHNIGFGRADDLRTLTAAWRTLFALCRPDLIVCDHCPIGMFAAALDGIACVNLGTGFTCPPVGERLPVLRYWMQYDSAKAKSTEDRLLTTVNSIRADAGLRLWARLSELYASPAETFLTTFAELDHLRERTAPRYWGVWEGGRGNQFEWPHGDGPRVFLYTHRFPALGWLLDHLRNRGWPTVACVQEPPAGAVQRFAGSTVALATNPLDMRQAAAECDFAILNAGHNSVAQFLLAGKPLLLLPISLEQGILTRRLGERGLAVSAGCDNPAEIQRGLDDVLNGGCLADAVRGFAQKHAAYDPIGSQSELTDRMEACAAAVT